MTTTLTTNEQELVRRMTQGEDMAEWGFELLLEHRPDDLDKFFDLLNDSGLFRAEHCQGPVPSENEGYVHIPFWKALDYFAAVAKIAGEKDDPQLADKVLDIVRTVSRFEEPDGSRRDNYHTYRIFSEILGLVSEIPSFF
ncbi:MAG: hypothetical protein O7D86_05020 [Proteobacteria bacterium]|nr:hypothetical protein [Pseudomonadota bacterium]